MPKGILILNNVPSISFVKVDLAAMILDDLLCYRETESLPPPYR